MALGALALAIAVVAAYVAAVKFFADDRLDRADNQTGVGQQAAARPPPPPTFASSDYDQARFPRLTGRPLLGVNYTHYEFPGCTFHKTYIPAWYHRPGVAEKVHEQLMRMRENGIATIRTVLWHDDDGQDWGPLPSRGGILREPFRSNLANYVAEVKRFGFARLTIAFEPERTHNPLRRVFEPAKLAENWRFITEVRSVVKRHGPRNTRFDLFSEGAPNEAPTRYEPLPHQTARYIRVLYRTYVQRFGNRDVSVSAIGSFKASEQTNRLEYLIRTLKASGAALPRWYDLHIGYIPQQAAHALRHGLAALRKQRQKQPLVIGDSGYDNAGVALAIRRALRSADRSIEEVSPWYTHVRLGCQVTPPYAPGAYGTVLHG